MHRFIIETYKKFHCSRTYFEACSTIFTCKSGLQTPTKVFFSFSRKLFFSLSVEKLLMRAMIESILYYYPIEMEFALRHAHKIFFTSMTKIINAHVFIFVKLITMNNLTLVKINFQAVVDKNFILGGGKANVFQYSPAVFETADISPFNLVGFKGTLNYPGHSVCCVNSINQLTIGVSFISGSEAFVRKAKARKQIVFGRHYLNNRCSSIKKLSKKDVFISRVFFQIKISKNYFFPTQNVNYYFLKLLVAVLIVNTSVKISNNLTNFTTKKIICV